jgi:hypothetical protein
MDLRPFWFAPLAVTTANICGGAQIKGENSTVHLCTL